jgi:galactokinase
VAVCLSELSGRPLSGMELARASHRAEAEFVGVPCGVMDQMISALGQRGQAMYLDTRTSAFEYIPFDPEGAGLTLVVVDTRVRHRLTEGRYGQRRRECEEAAGILGVGSLRDVGAGELPAALSKLPEPLRRRVRHVVTENNRVLEVCEALAGRDFERAGAAFVRSHDSLRTEFEVSCPELDTAVHAAMEAGALGARMTGAGFGGSAIALVAMERVGAVGHHIRAAFARRGFMAPAVFEVVPSPGAARL